MIINILSIILLFTIIWMTLKITTFLIYKNYTTVLVEIILCEYYATVNILCDCHPAMCTNVLCIKFMQLSST